jgi:hypothetical protein
MKLHWGSGIGGIAPRIPWPRRQMEESGQLHPSGSFIPRETAPGTNWTGGWVVPKAVLDAVV